MSNADVGPSRDGDQFHYARAARICLELLAPGSDLKIVSVEGIALAENIDAGLESIDLGLYYGDADPVRAKRVSYRQLKHSTLHSDKEWTASGLKKSLEDFSARYQKLVESFGRDDVAARFSFEFETNRPFAPGLLDALTMLKQGGTGQTERYLRAVIGLSGNDLSTFLSLFRPIQSVANYLGQRQLLEAEFGRYLPDGDKDAALKLRDLVARKATSEYGPNREIRREDVLHAIGTSIRDLFPAPSELEALSSVVPRVQLPDLADAIRTAASKLIVTADGGVGKSVVATQLASHLVGDRTFVYDCFGNGAYRSASGHRHRAKDGLVQIANDMAVSGLCDPLIATSKADDAAYVRAFVGRLTQASEVLHANGNEGTLLVIVIDAADNAQMAADDFQDPPSFPQLLLAETLPKNVRIVLTARPHRVSKLRPSPDTPLFELHPFTEEETRRLLQTQFPEATNQEVREFHRLTSQNPRVQRAALEVGQTLAQVLAALGPFPRSVDDTIGSLLAESIAKVRFAASDIEQPQLDALCAALATLRPFVPIGIIAATADVPVELVRSFVNDLRRPLLIRDDAVQFRDEPTETWFQEHFYPASADLEAFINRLTPFSSTSSYVAAALPALLLLAGKLDSLVQLALKSEALPVDNTIARRDVELQRLQFATKAALRAKRFDDAAKLLMKAGGEVAADSRQQALLSKNTDLATKFLDSSQLMEQVSRRLIVGGEWTGSEHAYEAALLSGNPGLAGDAMGQLRLAYSWLDHWSRRDRSDKKLKERVSTEDIAELLWAELNLHGAESCAQQLRRWKPRDVSFRAGKLLAERLVDAARWSDLEDLALAAGNDIGLILAIAVELDDVGRCPPRDAISRSIRLVASSRVRLEAPDDWRGKSARLGAVTTLVFFSRQYRLASKQALAALLRRYLPKTPPGTLESEYSYDDRAVLLRAYALMGELTNKTLRAEHLVDRSRRISVVRDDNYDSDARKFRQTVASLVPFHVLQVRVRLGRVPTPELDRLLDDAREHWTRLQRDQYSQHAFSADEVATIWSDIIVHSARPAPSWERLNEWQASQRNPLFIPTFARLARRIALTGGPTEIALSFVERGRARAFEDNALAESIADTYVSLARAILVASPNEARQYFEEAIAVSAKIGHENLERWQALLHLADACRNPSDDSPKLAYRFSRSAELTYSYVDRDKHFDWEHTVCALTGLSARSGPAILSRWSDRKFGSDQRLFPQLIEALTERAQLDPRNAVAFLPFDGYWDWDKMILAALDRASRPDERQVIADSAYQYIRFAVRDAGKLERIGRAFAANNIDPSSVLALAGRGQLASTSSTSGTSFLAGNDEEPDWPKVFAGVDVTTATGQRVSFERIRVPGHKFWRDEWMREALARVPAGQEQSFIESFAAALDPSPHTLSALLGILPRTWEDRLSARKALATLTKQVFRRAAESIWFNRHYRSLPSDLVLARVGLSTADILAEVLDAVANTSLPTTSEGLFRLIPMVAHFVTPAQGRDALEYGLDLLENALGEEHGDGPWRDALDPPTEIVPSLAGYLWAALGAVDASRRWEAAHTVRACCRLGRIEMLDALMTYASGQAASAFVDARFHFYKLHALQWLVMALSRAASESGQIVARYATFLTHLASRQNSHVLMRALAAKAMLTLDAQGLVSMTDSERASLRNINESPFDPVVSKAHSRARAPKQSRKAADDEFTFGYDFERNWVESVARIFAVPADDIEDIAREVISVEWGLSENGRYDRDARAMQGHFKEHVRRRGRSTGGSDNLAFYLSYHALMSATGRLLETLPLHVDPDDDWSSFGRWLKSIGLTRTDGRWLSDVRQIPPDDCIAFPSTTGDAWPKDASARYTTARLRPTPDTIVVAGYWTQYQGNRAETIRINTALASSERVGALARALASTRNPYDFALPEWGDTHEIHHVNYVFEGWLVEAGTDPGLDANDPWAASIQTRMREPGDAIRDKLELTTDITQQAWYDQTGSRALWLEVWSEGEDDERAPAGHRLVARRGWIDDLLRATDRTMLVEISCNRRTVPYSYERFQGTDSEQREEVTRIYTITPKAGVKLVPGSPRPRRKARRRAKAR